ncbi:hypothetical protein RND71_016545 [Anisodus tanguticus]|uniref:Uncharacterized protein n=1 Tax=Anisodus tanguticus TaxID=243964 RepID=A0AAE1S8Q9_9SOLA|nr:hypothetical protein RND71_016545 [Anisodus tanguticus]
MTKECHQKSLCEVICDVQQRLIDAKEESTKVTEHIEDIQARLAIIGKELRNMSAKRKKTIALTDEQKDQLSKSQENIIIFEGEIQAIEENRPLSEDEILQHKEGWPLCSWYQPLARSMERTRISILYDYEKRMNREEGFKVSFSCCQHRNESRMDT